MDELRGGPHERDEAKLSALAGEKLQKEIDAAAPQPAEGDSDGTKTPQLKGEACLRIDPDRVVLLQPVPSGTEDVSERMRFSTNLTLEVLYRPLARVLKAGPADEPEPEDPVQHDSPAKSKKSKK